MAEYGDLYKSAMQRVRALKDKPIAHLFELPKGEQSKVKTEILFIERCLALLQPGGRLGIVLPEGVFNNPSLAYVREFCENRAYIRAVVSLPQETFYSSGATVKASLLFMQKFTVAEQQMFDDTQAQARAEIDAKYAAEIEAETQRLQAVIDEAKKTKETAKRTAAQKELKDYLKRVEQTKKAETRALLKERFVYPIFMYEAEHVGITATGEADSNELYPNDNLPTGVEKTCLDLYREFRENPQAFMLDEVAA